MRSCCGPVATPAARRHEPQTCRFATRVSANFHAAAAVAILLLSACGSNPPIISGDTSCESFRYVSANDAQVKVFADNWDVMESYADQVISNNIEYTRKCLGVAP